MTSVNIDACERRSEGTHMAIRNLDKFVQTESVAVVGASQRANAVGYTVLGNLRHGGFAGSIMAVDSTPQRPSLSRDSPVPCSNPSASVRSHASGRDREADPS